jgi:putative intracellular protease/amidase
VATGASSYQFAFTGRYSHPSYNGNATIKAAANQVINDFLAQDKYVAGLCNGVSVLAWARVHGKSPLDGKKVCAPALLAPAGVYNGKQAQPSCRWHPEQNKATVVPSGSVGRPNTREDDVVVDGNIITGEDDSSARALGRTLADLLKAK